MINESKSCTKCVNFESCGDADDINVLSAGFPRFRGHAYVLTANSCEEYAAGKENDPWASCPDYTEVGK